MRSLFLTCTVQTSLFWMSPRRLTKHEHYLGFSLKLYWRCCRSILGKLPPLLHLSLVQPHNKAVTGTVLYSLKCQPVIKELRFFFTAIVQSKDFWFKINQLPLVESTFKKPTLRWTVHPDERILQYLAESTCVILKLAARSGATIGIYNPPEENTHKQTCTLATVGVIFKPLFPLASRQQLSSCVCAELTALCFQGCREPGRTAGLAQMRWHISNASTSYGSHNKIYLPLTSSFPDGVQPGWMWPKIGPD